VKVFAWEYVTSGGLEGSEVSPVLLAEAQAMVGRLAADLSAIPRVEALIAGDPAPRWQDLLGQADIVWPVAPETSGVLERVAAIARAACQKVLISGPQGLAIAASKARTAEHLAAHSVATVPTWASWSEVEPSAHGYVVKPDDGAGAEDTEFVTYPLTPALSREGRGGAAVPLEPSPLAGEGWVRGRIIQPYMPGQPVSLSLLVKEGEAWVLSCNTQNVTLEDNRFVYRGGTVGGAEHRRAALEPIAAAVAASLPDLFGYVGIDLIDAAEGPVLVEINPRLTTSYVGLRDSLGLNPAELALALLDRPLAALRRPLHPRPVDVTVPA
jgi:predicted ATP-grasp superfamily ATP-dependent carboligase